MDIAAIVLAIISIALNIVVLVRGKKGKAPKVEPIEGAVKIKKVNGSIVLTDAAGNKILEL